MLSRSTAQAVLELHSLHGVDVGVADEVLEMPLHGVYPAFQVEPVLNRFSLVWIADRRVDVIFHVIIVNCLVKNLIAELGKRHFIIYMYSCWLQI